MAATAYQDLPGKTKTEHVMCQSTVTRQYEHVARQCTVSLVEVELLLFTKMHIQKGFKSSNPLMLKTEMEPENCNLSP